MISRLSRQLLRNPQAGQMNKSVVRKNHYGWDEGNVATPPRVFVPFWEKVMHGFLLIGGITSFPLYVMGNMDKWRGGPPEQH